MQADKSVAIIVLVVLSLSAMIPVALASHKSDHRDGATIGTDDDWTDGPDNFTTWGVYGINRSEYVGIWSRDLEAINDDTAGQNPWNLSSLKDFVNSTSLNQSQKNITVQYFQLAAGSDFSTVEPPTIVETWNARDHANTTIGYGPKTRNYSNYSTAFSNVSTTFGFGSTTISLPRDENYPADVACIKFPDRDNSLDNKPDQSDGSLSNYHGYDPNTSAGPDARDVHCFVEDAYIDEHSIDDMVVLHEKNRTSSVITTAEPEGKEGGSIRRFIPNESTARAITDYRVNVTPSQYPNEYDEAEWEYNDGSTLLKVMKSHYTFDQAQIEEARITSADGTSSCDWSKRDGDPCVYEYENINPGTEEEYAPVLNYSIDDNSAFGFTEQEFNYQVHFPEVYTRHNTTCVVIGNPDDDDSDDDPDVGPYVDNADKYRDGYDTDDDGIDDRNEDLGGPSDSQEGDTDTDNDGLTDDVENTYGSTTIDVYDAGSDTNPNDADTDNDGLEDGAELSNNADPLVKDTDGDGLEDGPEVNNHGTEPDDTDSDGDGLSDSAEVGSATDATDSDTDGDGFDDSSDSCPTDSETNNGYQDGDGCPDTAPSSNSSNSSNLTVAGDYMTLTENGTTEPTSPLADVVDMLMNAVASLSSVLTPLADLATATIGAAADPHNGPEHGTGGPHWKYNGDNYDCTNDDETVSGDDKFGGSIENSVKDDDSVPTNNQPEDPETDEVYAVLPEEPSEADIESIRRELWNGPYGGELSGDSVSGDWSARSSYRQGQDDVAVSGQKQYGGTVTDKTYVQLDKYNVENPNNVTYPWQDNATHPNSVYNADRPSGLRDYQVIRYPDGDIGVHIETDQPWRRINLHETKYGLTSGWSYFSARNEDFDRYYKSKNETDRVIPLHKVNNSTTHPLKIHAYPTKSGPEPSPPSAPIADRHISVVSVNDSTTLDPPSLERASGSFKFYDAKTSGQYTQAKDLTFRYDRDKLNAEVSGGDFSKNRIKVESVLRNENETLGYTDSNLTTLNDTRIESTVEEINRTPGNRTAVIRYTVYKNSSPGSELNISRWYQSSYQSNPCVKPSASSPTGFTWGSLYGSSDTLEPTTEIEHGAGYMTGEGVATPESYGLGQDNTGEVVLHHNLTKVNGTSIEARFVAAQWWDTPACYPKQTDAVESTPYDPRPVFTGLVADILSLLIILFLISLGVNWVYKAAGSKRERSFFVWFYNLMKETLDRLIR